MSYGGEAGGRISSDTQALMMFDANKKSVGIGYVIWFFLGWLGGHRFYLGKTGSAVAILLMTIVGWLLVLAVVGAILLIIVGIWLLIDAFLIPGWVREYNNGLAERIGGGLPVAIRGRF